jgi:hypothetical protein
VQAIEAALHIEAGSDIEAALPYGAAAGVWQPVAVADVVGNTGQFSLTGRASPARNQQDEGTGLARLSATFVSGRRGYYAAPYVYLPTVN